MKRLILSFVAALLGGLTVFAFGQWQVQPQIDNRVGPIYPVNPSYNFHSNSNADPFQFNWASGRWEYVPFAGGSSTARPWQYSPPPSAPDGNQQSPYVFGEPPAMNPPQSNSSSPSAASPNIGSSDTPPSPDDSQFWNAPTTQPEKTVAPQIVKFEGHIVSVKAMNFMGEAFPHLLLRLVNKSGATGTVDVGQRLALPDAVFDPAVKGYVTVTGQLGVLDGHLLLFADQIAFGSQTVAIERRGRTTNQ